MTATIIGVDPHKRSHTAVVLDGGEQVASQLRVTAGPKQVNELLAWAPDGERVWAIENVNGLGHLLAQQLLARAEVVIDVPATLSSRARKLSGKSGRKTDEHDARSVAIAAAHNNQLRRVTVENNSVVLGLLLARRWQLVSQRQRTICQLHAVLNELVPAGAAKRLTSKKAAALLRKGHPGQQRGARTQAAGPRAARGRALARQAHPGCQQATVPGAGRLRHDADRDPRHR